MTHFYLDASGLVKRYIVEVGSAVVNHLLAQVTPRRLTALSIGVGEVLSVLVRRRNAQLLSANAYSQSVSQLRSEVLDSTDLRLQPVDESLVRASLSLMEQYSLNATDALVLRSALNLATQLRSAGHKLALVTSDMRLVNAAQAEGLETLNPETDPQARVDELVAAAP